MSRLRVGVVGVGHLGRHHARILASMAGVELVGVADARPAQAREVAAQCGTRAFVDYHELLDRVDAISIAVPTRSHGTVAAAFLDRGVPTLVEKPLAASVAEAETLVNLAQKRGAALQVGHIERFNPALATLDALRSPPRFLTAERTSTYTFRSTDIGAVLDLMIHDLDLILSRVAAPWRSVSAVGGVVFGGQEDVALARVEFADGCVAHFTANRASPRAVRAWSVWTRDEFATLDLAAKRGTVIRPSEMLRRGALDLEGLDLKDPAAIQAHVFGKLLRVDSVEPSVPHDQLTLELAEFVRAARDGARPRVGGMEALRALRLAEEILHSLRAHTWTLAAERPASPARRAESHATPPAPQAWRHRTSRQKPSPPGA
jgi:predicted dehydrogenase